MKFPPADVCIEEFSLKIVCELKERAKHTGSCDNSLSNDTLAYVIISLVLIQYIWCSWAVFERRSERTNSLQLHE